MVPFPERPPVDAEGLQSSNSARLTPRRSAVRPLMKPFLTHATHILYNEVCSLHVLGSAALSQNGLSQMERYVQQHVISGKQSYRPSFGTMYPHGSMYGFLRQGVTSGHRRTKKNVHFLRFKILKLCQNLNLLLKRLEID